MLSFIIPIINPLHDSKPNMKKIQHNLYQTITNIKKINVPKLIIIVTHSIPNFYNNDKEVIYLILTADIFDYLGKENPPLNNFNEWLIMPGENHNKDKGLKYFLGLLWLFNKKTPEYIFLADGDDFIHSNLLFYLNKLSKKNNLFYLNKGYLKIEKKLYYLDDFTNTCGTNRIFKANFFKKTLFNLIHPFRHRDQINKLVKYRQFNNNLIRLLSDNIIIKPRAWTFIPLFLGVHRIYLNQEHHIFCHYILQKFNFKFLNLRLVIKNVHESNHSTRDIIQSDLEKRYFLANPNQLPLCQEIDIQTNANILLDFI
jgi:hypothetical protein